MLIIARNAVRVSKVNMKTYSNRTHALCLNAPCALTVFRHESYAMPNREEFSDLFRGKDVLEWIFRVRLETASTRFPDN